MTNKNLVGFYYSKIVKSLRHLEYSYKRTLLMPLNPVQMNESEMEAWDSFASRFARSSDIFLSKYIKAFITQDDPAFDGSFRDFLNRAEKLKLVDDTVVWMDIRELRNAIVHEYSDIDLEKIHEKFRKYAPLILALEKRLAHATRS